MRTVWVRLLLMVAIVGCGDASAEGDGPVLPLLRGFEWQLDARRFAELPPDTYVELLAIAGDRNLAPYLRERAAVALSLYPNGEVLEFFIGQIALDEAPILRRNLVQAFCNAFSAHSPDRVEAAIGGLLEAEDAHLRIRVARCLRGLGTESAAERVEKYRAAITQEWERKQVALD